MPQVLSYNSPLEGTWALWNNWEASKIISRDRAVKNHILLGEGRMVAEKLFCYTWKNIYYRIKSNVVRKQGGKSLPKMYCVSFPKLLKEWTQSRLYFFKKINFILFIYRYISSLETAHLTYRTILNGVQLIALPFFPNLFSYIVKFHL